MNLNGITSQLASSTLKETGKLSFAGRGLKLDTEEQASEISNEIKNFKDLITLDLSGNTFGIDAAKGIGKALECQSKFKHALWTDMFTGRLKQEIPKALHFLSSGLMLASAQLVELDLSDNAFGPIGVDGILNLLRSKTCYTLEELKLNNNGLGITGGKALAASLLDCHKSSSEEGRPLALKVFISGRNRLENPGAIALSKVFKAIGTLEQISMPQNGINHEGITALSDSFTKNNQLHSINLNDNTFTEVGASAMAKTIPYIPSLKSLNFGDCLLRTEGAISIANALKGSHQDLEELNLSYNEIKCNGGLAIIEAFKNKSKLREVQISGNQFGENGLKSMETALDQMGKSNLISFDDLSDDEDDDDDDDDDDDENYEDIDDEDSEDDECENLEEVKPYQSPLLKNTNLAENEKCSASEFLASPDLIKLSKLGANSSEQIDKYLQEKECKCEQLVAYFMKVSQLINSKSDDYYKIRLITDVIMKIACQLADQQSTSTLTDSILLHFGLLKSEDKSFKIPVNLTGPYLLLAHCVDQSYFLKPIERSLKFFLTSEKNEKYLKCGGDELLKILNKHGVM